MHEIAICQSILDIVKAQARSRKFRKVKRVRLEVGPFSGVEIEALRFGFDVVARNTLADGAVLEIDQTEAVARCLCCNLDSHIKQRFDACPHCGSHRLKITAGEELRIKELEVE